jgi:coniferyl-aldehyde dehydrogenase
VLSRSQCVTVDTVYVPRASVNKFVELAKAYQQRVGPYASSENCTSIISLRHMDRLENILSSAKSSGATVINMEPNAQPDRKTRRMPLFLVLDPKPDLEIMKEEIFGPILPIIPFDNLDDVIHTVNAGERPLALYVFGDNQQLTDIVIKSTVSGGVCVNTAALQGAFGSLGFGGSGNSGMGRLQGIEVNK